MYDVADGYRVVKVGVMPFPPRGAGTKPSQHFPVPTSCLASISLAPTGNYLAVWEGSLEVGIMKLSTLARGSTRPDSINSSSTR